MSEVSWMDGARASQIIRKNLDDGKSRVWLCEQIGTTMFYLTLALHKTKRPRSDGEAYLCPVAEIKNMLDWERRQWIGNAPLSIVGGPFVPHTEPMPMVMEDE